MRREIKSNDPSICRCSCSDIHLDPLIKDAAWTSKQMLGSSELNAPLYISNNVRHRGMSSSTIWLYVDSLRAGD